MNPGRRNTDDDRLRALDFIRQYPGTKTARLTLAQRRHLRALEQAGLIRFDRTTESWFPTDPPKETP